MGRENDAKALQAKQAVSSALPSLKLKLKLIFVQAAEAKKAAAEAAGGGGGEAKKK